MAVFFYFGKRVDATRVGGFDVQVQCDKCGCDYYYELTRVGSGAGEAPYGIGAGLATRSAENQAKRDLQKRLASEADLVPCPQCNWINDDLIRGYRLGRYRGLWKTAWIIALLGTVIALLCSWYLSIGPPADRRAIPYFLYGGPALSLALAASVLLLQFLLRRRIRPNRRYPNPPILPVNTPPALILDKKTGQARLAKPNRVEALGVPGWQDFQLERHQLPPVCCTCMQPTPKEHRYEIPLGDSSVLEIPYCESCAQSAGRIQGWLIFVAIILLVAGMTYALMSLDSAISGAVACNIIILFFVAVGIIALTYSNPVEAIVVDRARGVVRLRLGNAKYGRLAIEHIRDAKNGR